jgi:hypothetical protein
MNAHPAAPARHQHWQFTVLALATVLTLAITATVWWISNGSQARTRSQWQPPNVAQLQSMRTKPVAGWTTDVVSLGLPSSSTITTGDAPWLRGPVIEIPNQRAVVLARSPGPVTAQWWLVGVDTSNGRPLFRPVPLNATARTPSCFVNGPDVVCIDDDQAAATAWVVEVSTGRLVYTGPSKVRTITGPFKAEQVGNYLVASTEREGIYGVGADTQTTWFIPNAAVAFGYHNDDIAVGGRTTLFALKDGAAITPDFPRGANVHSMTFFDGGFAAEFVVGADPSFFQFFDTAGKLTSTEHVGGFYISGSSANLTSIVGDVGFRIYGPTGHELLDVDGPAPKGMQLIGTTLWLGNPDGGATSFQSYDMRTGDKGNACEFDAYDGYLGTDGSVFVRAPSNYSSDDLAKAYDLATCQLVWSIPRPKGSMGRVNRVDNTLLEVSDDGTELWSLVPPH